MACIILGLITMVVSELLGISKRINPVDTGVLNIFWIRAAGVAFIVALITYVILSYIIIRREKFTEENAPRRFAFKREPRTVHAEDKSRNSESNGRASTGRFGCAPTQILTTHTCTWKDRLSDSSKV